MKSIFLPLALLLANNCIVAWAQTDATPNPDIHYHLGPDSLPDDGVPKGEIRGPFTLPSEAYPGTQHTYSVYVPAQYDPAVPANLMIFNDGQAFMNPEGDLRAQNVLDNLIYRREIPVMIAVFINPGRRPDQPEPNAKEWGDKTTNRPTEYNSLDDKYARVIVDELLPVLAKDYNLSKDPERRGIGGASSGAIAAFTVAWERPDQFRKVLSIVGSFTNIRGGDAYPDIIQKNDKKPIRIFLQDGRNDNRSLKPDGTYDERRDWFLQNTRMVKALTEKGYEVNYTFGMNKHGSKMGGAVMPEMMRWLWRDQPVSTDPHDNVERSFREPVKKNETALLSDQDHQRLMDLLGIKTLRRGADGTHPDAPNAANYDESKANPFPNLPDPLLLKNGREVTKAKDWWKKRRPEIVEDFDREIYGRTPPNLPAVKWEVVSTTKEMTGDVPVITKKLIGHVDNSTCPRIAVNIDLTLSTPAAAKGPVPIAMELTFVFRPGMRLPPTAGPSWREQVLNKGWGYASLIPTSVQPDNGAGLTEGIIGLANKGQPRGVDDWGALKAWAWGASRALDYFETDPAVDARHVAIEGHSRYGKAALVAMAYDPRFAVGYISSSGEGGAKLYRRNWGELPENVAASSEYHWMAGNFMKYSGPLGWNDMPVDSHELIALCAPRPVFIGAGATQGDGWADAKGMFLAEVGAGPVYRLLGKKDLGTTAYPPIETALIEGDLGFRQHSGGHTPAPNWPTFIEFAGKYMNGTGVK